MNILLMPSWYPGYNQTADTMVSEVHGIFILDQIRLLAESKNNVTVFLPRMTKFLRFDKIRLRIRKEDSHKEVEFTFPKLFPIFKYGYYLSFNLVCVIGYFLIRIFINREKIGLIHSHVLFLSGYSSSILKRIFGVPCILTEHTGPFIINNELEKKLASSTFKRIDALIAVSPDLLKNIEKYNFDITRKYIVGNAVDTEFFAPKALENKRKKHVFLNVSMFYEYKGLDYLLRAAKILLEKGIEDFEVLIGGDGPYKGNLIEFIEKNGLSGFVKFAGILTKKEVREFFYKSDTFVFPSLKETFGIAVAEAMSCGIPAIATINGGSENIITGNTGILIEPKNEEQLAEAMLKRIRNEIVFEEATIRRHIVENWSFEATMKKYREIWKEII